MSTRAPKPLPRISRSIEDIRASVYGWIEGVQDQLAALGFLPRRLNLNKGMARGFIEIVCWGLWQLYTLLEKLLTQAVPRHASGDWLDLHADGVGLERRPALKASGLVLFLRDRNYQGGNVRIPAGRIVRTQPGGAGNVYRYVTTADAVLPADADRVAVPVKSEEYGAAANASAGQICELVTPVPGVRSVTNAAGWLASEGADEETDAQLRERYELVWRANNGCTKYAYKAWALSVPGVASVEILDRHPRGQGTVDVVVRGTAIIPTEALLQKVRAAIAPNVPINDDWLVKGPDPVVVGIAGTLECVDVDPELAREAAELRLRALFLDASPYEDVTPLAIGQDVPLDLLTHTVMGVRGVKRVTWTAPAADVVVPKSGMAVLESLSLNTVMAEEA